VSDAEDVVRTFCKVVGTRDPAAVRPLLHDDIAYLNVGMPVTRGIDAVMANLQSQWESFTKVFEFEVRHLAVDGDVVLTERVDVVSGEGLSMAVPVMGIFELVDGRIRHWRDYFDTGLLAKLGAGEDVSELIPETD
jgi:limonene-1,2-epoxide hydrolase